MVEGWIIEKRKKEIESGNSVSSVVELQKRGQTDHTPIKFTSNKGSGLTWPMGFTNLALLYRFQGLHGAPFCNFNQLLFSLPSTVIHGSCFWAVLGKAVLRSHISHANIHAHLDCVKCVSEVQLIHNGLRRTLSERSYTGFHTVGSLAGPSFSGDCHAKHFKWILKIGIKGIGSRGRDLQEPLKNCDLCSRRRWDLPLLRKAAYL